MTASLDCGLWQWHTHILKSHLGTTWCCVGVFLHKWNRSAIIHFMPSEHFHVAELTSHFLVLEDAPKLFKWPLQKKLCCLPDGFVLFVFNPSSFWRFWNIWLPIENFNKQSLSSVPQSFILSWYYKRKAKNEATRPLISHLSNYILTYENEGTLLKKQEMSLKNVAMFFQNVSKLKIFLSHSTIACCVVQNQNYIVEKCHSQEKTLSFQTEK